MTAHKTISLGNARAEADTEMLQKAFVVTTDLQALLNTTAFNFVVGRRGTGKSALFSRLRAELPKTNDSLVATDRVDEAAAMSLRDTISKLVSGSAEKERYRQARAICRKAWVVDLLVTAANTVLTYVPELHAHESSLYLSTYKKDHAQTLSTSSTGRCEDIIRAATRGMGDPNPERVPRLIVEMFKSDLLRDHVANLLRASGRPLFIIQDGLDEGWAPDVTSTSILAGLTLATADMADQSTGIHVVLFIRDNIFRALAQLDGDGSRHLDGSSLRLKWNAETLFALVTERLRVAFNLHANLNQAQVWNRSVENALHNLAGFRKCLLNTLYRPRDALVLFNDAFTNARRASREKLLEQDVQAAATEISNNRLHDLFKEYDQVLPGLRLFVEIFRESVAVQSLGQVLAKIRAAREARPQAPGSSDFDLFQGEGTIFTILQSVGFLGVRDESSQRYVFCHDGADTELDIQNHEASVAVHPCYWRALGTTVGEDIVDGIIDIHDEYRVDARAGLTDMRTARFGQVVGQLPMIDLGTEGQRGFEDWASTTISVLLEGETAGVKLSEPTSEHEPRVLLATLRHKLGSRVWTRICADYALTLLVVSIVNVGKLTPDHVRAAGNTSLPGSGRLRLLISRDDGRLSEETKNAFYDVSSANDVLVVHMGAKALARCFHKQRRIRRKEYTDKQLSKVLELTVQSVSRIAQARRTPPAARSVRP